MNTPTKPLTSVDKIIDQIAVAMHDWQVKQVTTIGETVRQKLDEQREQVLLKLMGFNIRSFSGTWELDHCNGRAGESIAGDFFKEKQVEAIKRWLAQIPLPEMTPNFKKTVAKQLQQTYEEEALSMVYGMAKRAAERDMSELLTAVTKSTQVEMHLRMQKLLNPTPSE